LLFEKNTYLCTVFFQPFAVLDKLRPYQIDLKNLSQGSKNTFEYKLEDDFFEDVEGDEISHGKVDVSLTIKRVITSFELLFDLSGIVGVSCDRCLEDVDIPIKSQNKLIVTFGEKYSDTGDERIIVPEEEGEINVAWFMYEFIVLAIPLKRVHQEGECNEEMAAILDRMRVYEVAEEDGDEISDDMKTGIDPRWNALKNLKKEN
jgi:uncharacterized metal-binding protein YceD (DUF177 family)